MRDGMRAYIRAFGFSMTALIGLHGCGIGRISGLSTHCTSATHQNQSQPLPLSASSTETLDDRAPIGAVLEIVQRKGSSAIDYLAKDPDTWEYGQLLFRSAMVEAHPEGDGFRFLVHANSQTFSEMTYGLEDIRLHVFIDKPNEHGYVRIDAKQPKFPRFKSVAKKMYESGAMRSPQRNEVIEGLFDDLAPFMFNMGLTLMDSKVEMSATFCTDNLERTTEPIPAGCLWLQDKQPVELTLTPETVGKHRDTLVWLAQRTESYLRARSIDERLPAKTIALLKEIEESAKSYREKASVRNHYYKARRAIEQTPCTPNCAERDVAAGLIADLFFPENRGIIEDAVAGQYTEESFKAFEELGVKARVVRQEEGLRWRNLMLELMKQLPDLKKHLSVGAHFRTNDPDLPPYMFTTQSLFPELSGSPSPLMKDTSFFFQGLSPFLTVKKGAPNLRKDFQVGSPLLLGGWPIAYLETGEDQSEGASMMPLPVPKPKKQKGNKDSADTKQGQPDSKSEPSRQDAVCSK